jgi:iron complex transport system ATP-binding protein
VTLRAERVSWSVQGQRLLHAINLDAPTGSVVGLVGPNGSGKSSLLRTFYRLYRPQTGRVLLEGSELERLSTREVARRMAVVLQEAPGPFDFMVEEVVLMGRTPHKGLFERESQQDHHIAFDALARVRMESFVGRSFLTLSGGEKQRVLIARALAQQARLLLLDEPTNHLDIRYQLEILELVRGLRVTTVAALHDLNLAASYCDRLYVLSGGQVVAQGDPETVLTSELIQQVFGVAALIEPHPATGRPHIAFLPPRAWHAASP